MEAQIDLVPPARDGCNTVLPGHGDQISIGLAVRRFDGWAAGG
jgi:hypothetical protein